MEKTSGISPRELEVLKRIADGLTSSQIAYALKISGANAINSGSSPKVYDFGVY